MSLEAGVWVSLLVVVCVLWACWPRRPRGMPPGPLALPLLGNLLSFQNNRPFHENLLRLKQKYGPVFTVSMGTSWWLILNDYQSICNAFVKEASAFSGRPANVRETLKGSHTVKGLTDSSMSQEWKHQRSLVKDILQSLGLGKEGSERFIKKECAQIRQYILSHPPGRQLDISRQLSINVANVICQMLFQKRYDYKDQHINKILTRTEELSLLGEENTLGDDIPWLRYIWPAYSKTLENENKCIDILDSIFEDKLESCWGKMDKRGWTRPTCLMEAYLAELEDGNKNIQEDWSIEIIYDLFLAATETTTSTLQWSLLYMALWPDVQRRVQTETDGVFGQRSHVVSDNEQTSMPYTRATLLEIQRRAAVAASTLKHSTTKQANVGKYRIPKGTTVLANLHAVLMDPHTWANPEELVPERFLDETGSEVKLHKEWIPFGVGRRMCLGLQLAKQELFMFFVTLVHHFSISLPEDVSSLKLLEPVDVAILKPQSHKLIFKKRF